jgi:hypothetical protein
MPDPQELRWFHRLRHFNRQWIDRLDPDWPPVEDGQGEGAAHADTQAAPPGALNLAGERTPNPHALKFHVGVSMTQRTLLPDSHAPEDPLAPLLDVPGVVSVFAVEDFVTVLKRPEVEWDDMLSSVQAHLEALFN